MTNPTRATLDSKALNYAAATLDCFNRQFSATARNILAVRSPTFREVLQMVLGLKPADCDTCLRSKGSVQSRRLVAYMLIEHLPAFNPDAPALASARRALELGGQTVTDVRSIPIDLGRPSWLPVVSLVQPSYRAAPLNLRPKPRLMS
jgi:hypothetical protein